jgi:hypothetical protein
MNSKKERGDEMRALNESMTNEIKEAQMWTDGTRMASPHTTARTEMHNQHRKDELATLADPPDS